MREPARLQDGQRRIRRRCFDLPQCRPTVELRAVLATQMSREVGCGKEEFVLL